MVASNALDLQSHGVTCIEELTSQLEASDLENNQMTTHTQDT